MRNQKQGKEIKLARSVKNHQHYGSDKPVIAGTSLTYELF